MHESAPLPVAAAPEAVAHLPAEARTRGIEEDRAPREGERGKRKPRRDRSSIARQSEAARESVREGGRERGPALAEERLAQPNAEIIDVTPTSAALFPEREPAPAVPERAANDPRNPRPPAELLEPDVTAEPAIAPPVSQRAAPVPEPAVSPAVAAAAVTVPLAAPPPPREQPVGRALNDPREVRRREREAQLRREGVISSPENGG